MIKVNGMARLNVRYAVTLNMSEAQFDSLSEMEQNAALDAAIDWHNVFGDADIDEIEVYDVLQTLEEEK